MDTNLPSLVPTAGRGKYRHHPLDFKRALVELSLQPGASVARIAREHGVNANQVFSWRRLYQQGQLGQASARVDGLVPVTVRMEPPNEATTPSGSIVIEAGAVRVQVEGRVDVAVLTAVLERVLK